MKKIIILSLLTSLLYFNGLTQNNTIVLQNGMTWNIAHSWSSTSEIVYTINGDTTINSQDYKKIYQLNYDTVFINGQTNYYASIRCNDSGRVYVLYDDSVWNTINSMEINHEFLVYDFSLNIGDTINSNANTGYLGAWNMFHNPNSAPIVESVDSILINGVNKKRLKIFNGMTYEDEYWIDGIGSTKGLFYPISEFILGATTDLWCCKLNDNIFYIGNTTCTKCFCNIEFYDPNNIIGNTILNYPQIYPIPTKDYVIISQPNIDNIKVFNSIGNLLKLITKNPSTTNCIIDIQGLQNGIYYYQTIDKNGIIKTGKIIKEE